MDYRDNRPPTRKGGPYCTPIWGPGSTPIYILAGLCQIGTIAPISRRRLAATLPSSSVLHRRWSIPIHPVPARRLRA